MTIKLSQLKIAQLRDKNKRSLEDLILTISSGLFRCPYLFGDKVSQSIFQIDPIAPIETLPLSLNIYVVVGGLLQFM